MFFIACACVCRMSENYKSLVQQDKCNIEIFLSPAQARISKNIVLLSLKIGHVFSNSADPDEMPHNAAFHLSLDCFPEYLERGFWLKD